MVVVFRGDSEASYARDLRSDRSGGFAISEVVQMKRVNKMLLTEIAVITALTLLSQLGFTRLQTPPPVVQVVVIGKSTPAAQATIYSADYCLPCKRYIKDVKETLPKDGWVIKDSTDKDSASANILISHDEKALEREKIESIPCTIIRKNGKEVRRITGKMKPDRLAEEINEVAKMKEAQ